MPDIQSHAETCPACGKPKTHDEIGRLERSAYTRIMNAMLTLEPASRVKVLGAVAIMVRPAVPAGEPPVQEKGTPPADGPA